MATSNPWQVMGILNVTPDSFYDGGRFLSVDTALAQVDKMLQEGATIIDLGGESTRPGAPTVSVEEELSRVLPVIKAVIKRISQIKLSIDTRKSEVARAALDAGVTMVNDISGFTDARMQQVLIDFPDCQGVMMHMQGTPQTMQKNPSYNDVVGDVHKFFAQQLDKLQALGIDRHRMIIDPGIGFGKTVQHNLELLRRLGEFKKLQQPILVGVSRKSFVGKLLGSSAEKPLPESERLAGSLAATLLAYQHGATIFRVHDVLPTVQVLTMATAIIGESGGTL